MSYLNSPLSPYSGALVLQLAPDPFYTFVSLSLMVLYELESLHLDDYNLTYIQNRNRDFDKLFYSISFENPIFPFYKYSSKPIQTNTNERYYSKINPKQPLTQLQPIKTPLTQRLGFSSTQTQEKGLGFSFSYLSILYSPPPSFLLVF